MSRRKNRLNVNQNHDYQFWDSASRNDFTFDFYVQRLIELGMSMFEWKGLPKPIDWRFIEYTLMYNAFSVFFNEDVIDEYAVLQATLSGKYDFYRVPFDRQVYSANGYQKHLTADNSVIIWNNVMRTPTIQGIMYYARKLYELDRTFDVNLNAQKTPVLITCDEEERFTLKNVYKQYDGNEPFIFGSKNLDLGNKVTVLKTDAPFLCDKIAEQKNQIWNDALTYLGISNINMQKKERLISDEVTRSMGGVIASRSSRLESRKHACDEINAMFGLNISVEVRQDYREVDTDIVQANSSHNEGLDMKGGKNE